MAVRAIPGWDPVAPPQLARHVPVADVREPVLPGLLESLGEDPGPARSRGLQGAGSQRLRTDEPLRLEARLEHVVAPLATPDDHLVRTLRGEVAAFAQCPNDPGTRLVAVEAVELRARSGHRRVVGEDRDRGEAVT